MWKVFLMVAVFGRSLTSASAQFKPPDGFEVVPDKSLDGYGALEKCGEGTRNGFKCVPYHRCVNKVVVPDEMISEAQKNGFGVIDIRVGQDAEERSTCPHYLDVCCRLPDDSSSSSSSPPPPSPKPTPTPPGKYFCGIRNPNGKDFMLKGNTNEAEYGEFPWMVAILKKYSQPHEPPAICGGSLIHPSVVLTGAHCVYNYKTDDLKIRAGEWDTQTTKERLPYQERDVKQIIIHENFQSKTLFNDFALLVLDTSVDAAEHIGTICLPNQDETIISKNCFASGWGKDVFGAEGKYQVILKKIELETIKHDECENQLRSTRLGKFFVLDQSFTCAIGEDGRDTCQGDGGSPLACPDPYNPNRYVLAGMVAWGIGCHEGIPSAYADVTKIRNWVDGHIARLNFNSVSYIS